MTSVFLSCYNLPIIKQVAWVLGQAMNLLYELFSKVGILNIGLCIIVFTIIVKLLMLPMTIKQQRYSKLSSIMNPEIQAVQKKYSGKRDQDSLAKMNQETSAIYEKYGTSPSGGCLQLLIQMPIILALYGVISSITTYVPDVADMFKDVTKEVVVSAETFYEIDKLDEIANNSKKNELDTFLDNYYVSKDGKIDTAKTDLKLYSGYTDVTTSKAALWEDVYASYDDADKIIAKLSKLDFEAWSVLLKDKDNKKSTDLIEKYSKYSESDWSNLKASYKESRDAIESQHDELKSVYNFFGIDLSVSPGAGVWWALLIPILSAITQWLSMKITQSSQAQVTENNPLGSSMKAMTYTMPVMSAVFCYSLPAGLGLYWVISAVVQTVLQVIINKHFSKMDMKEIIKINIDKANEKRAKKGLPPRTISHAATVNVKNIKKEEEVKPVKTNNTNGSLSSKANLVNKYNNSTKK